MIRRNKKRYAKSLAICLLAASTILAGCGKKDIEFDEYGSVPDSSVSDSESSEKSGEETSAHVANKDSIDVISTTEGKLSEKLGGDTLEYSSDFSIGGSAFGINTSFVIDDTESLPTYSVTEITEEDVHEEEMVEKVFGGTGEALNKQERQYLRDDLGDSVPLIYTCLAVIYHNGGEYNYLTAKTKTWMDEEDYYIHTYEGTRNGIEYQFMVSYSRKYHEKVVALYPKRMGDLVGNPELDELDASHSDGMLYLYYTRERKDREFDTNVVMADRKNVCTMSKDDIRDTVMNSLHEDFFIDIPEGELDVECEDGKNEMVFYNQDMLTDSKLTGAVRNGYEANFRDTIGNQHVISSVVSIDRHSSDLDGGRFYVNDSGIVGLAAVATYNYGEILSDNVSVLRFEDAMKSLEEGIKENIDMSMANLSEGKTEFNVVRLMYCPIEDGNGGYYMIPAWVGDVENAGSISMRAVVSAIDGRFIKMLYYSE